MTDGRALTATLLDWYRRARRDLPWRRTRDPYAVWLSETMLQQTRVDTVVPYFERFLRELPTVQSLAEATEERVLSLWSGLGYYRRARMLHEAARHVVREHGGRLPTEAGQLRALQGVGAYTAGAVASIAFGRRAPVVDGNVARVLARVFAVKEDVGSGAGNRLLWRLAGELVDAVDGDPGDWNQALMELGATVCTPRDPRCHACPVAPACEARARGVQSDLPRTAARKAPGAMARVALVLASPSAVLLARRRREILFGGLWEPPGADGGRRALVALAQRLGIEPGALHPAGTVEHVLSHRRLVVSVVRGPLGRRRRWPLPGAEYDAVKIVPRDGLGRLAHATLARKVLAAAL